MRRILARFKLLHQFALLAVAFALLSTLGATFIWMKIDGLRKADTEIIERQYPSRLSLIEAKASAAAFAALAYRAQSADAEQMSEIKSAVGDEERRFRHWLQNVVSDDPQMAHDLVGIEARFDRLIVFLQHFVGGEAGAEKESRAFQLEYRFAPLRDDLDASINHLSNAIGRASQDYVEYAEHVLSVDMLRAIEMIGAGYATIFIGTILWAAFGIGRPLQKLASTTREIAAGRLDVAIAVRGYAQEISVMSRALEVFRDTLVFNRELEVENKAAKAEAEAAVDAERRRVSEIFRDDVMHAVMIVSSASSELQRSAALMREHALVTDRQAQTVVGMSQQTIDKVDTLSQFSGELSATVEAMNRQLLSAAEIAVAALSDGQSTTQSAHELVGAVDAIGKIADFISDVAYQINLLALNATIEAARCGEMGRGFAVVASEVKHLAHATSRAVADISNQLAAVKGATDEVVHAIGVTVDGIGRVGQMAGALEIAHGQKEVVAGKLTSCVDSVVLNTLRVSEVIFDVGQSTGETQRVADEMLSAALELSEQAERLLGRSRDFFEKIALSETA